MLVSLVLTKSVIFAVELVLDIAQLAQLVTLLPPQQLAKPMMLPPLKKLDQFLLRSNMR
jgi:hypothetical protein